jgi:hypothetical protein
MNCTGITALGETIHIKRFLSEDAKPDESQFRQWIENRIKSQYFLD